MSQKKNLYPETLLADYVSLLKGSGDILFFPLRQSVGLKIVTAL